MTGGRAVSANPYWDIVSPFVNEHESRHVVNGGNPEGSAVTGIIGVVAGLTFLFGFGNVLSLGVPGWVAPLVAPDVDLSPEARRAPQHR